MTRFGPLNPNLRKTRLQRHDQPHSRNRYRRKTLVALPRAARRRGDLPPVPQRAHLPAVPQDDEGDRPGGSAQGLEAAEKNEAPVEQAGTRWDDLLNASAPERLDTYKEMLLDYGLHGRGAVQEVYANANTFITKPATLSKLVTDIDALDWYSVDRDDLGDLYEDLLERNAGEKKSGAGQYFTPVT
jgi:hypothetical protein